MTSNNFVDNNVIEESIDEFHILFLQTMAIVVFISRCISQREKESEHIDRVKEIVPKQMIEEREVLLSRRTVFENFSFIIIGQFPAIRPPISITSTKTRDGDYEMKHDYQRHWTMMYFRSITGGFKLSLRATYNQSLRLTDIITETQQKMDSTKIIHKQSAVFQQGNNFSSDQKLLQKAIDGLNFQNEKLEEFSANYNHRLDYPVAASTQVISSFMNACSQIASNKKVSSSGSKAYYDKETINLFNRFPELLTIGYSSILYNDPYRISMSEGQRIRFITTSPQVETVLGSGIELNNSHTIAQRTVATGISKGIVQSDPNQNRIPKPIHHVFEDFQEVEFGNKVLATVVGIDKKDFVKNSITNYSISYSYFSKLTDPKLTQAVQKQIQQAKITKTKVKGFQYIPLIENV